MVTLTQMPENRTEALPTGKGSRKGFCLLATTVAIAFGGCGSALRDSGGGDVSRRSQSAPTYSVKVKGDWTIIRNGPAGIAIGNARTGWGLVGKGKSVWGYTLGRVTGDNGLAVCAWIDSRNLRRVGRLRESGCEWLMFARHYFGVLNCRSCSGGTKVVTVRAGTAYANYSQRLGFRDPLRKVDKGACVEWRWISKDRQAVMVKDRRFKNNQGSWVFLPRYSLPAKLQSAAARSCAR